MKDKKEVDCFCVCNIRVPPNGEDTMQLNGRLYHRDHLRTHLAAQLRTALAHPDRLVGTTSAKRSVIN